MSNKQKLIPLKSKVFAIQEEKANRRKLRILQVRQQERVIANRVRENVEKNKKQEILNIAEKLNQEFNLKKAEEILKSKEKYSNGLKEVGQAQNAAKDYVVEHALYQAKQSENKRVATHRFNSAIQHVHDVEVMNQQREQEVKERRIKVLSKEKLRAKQVSMLPSVSSSTQESEETVTTATLTSMRSCDTFCATMHEGDNDEGNAREAAEEEDQLIEEQERLKQCTLEAQRERAQLRYLSAIKRSKLHKEYNNLEKELQVMQKKEASRRRDLVGMNHPHCLPPHHPSDYPNDKQREMEQAFNDAFTSNIIPDTTLDVTMESELQDEIPQAEDIVPVVESDDVVPVDENEGRETPTPENGGRINAVNKLLKLVSKQQARGGSGEEKCESGTSSGETTSEEEISQPTDINDISEVGVLYLIM
nr:centrosomal protein of 295 kDa-like [Ciona intestinalis]|eukprot:XP_026690925.1 centrosomal protein of 295 kDa-like [Ciona intestinalis]